MGEDAATWKFVVGYLVWLLASAAIALTAGLLVGAVATTFGVEFNSEGHQRLITAACGHSVRCEAPGGPFFFGGPRLTITALVSPSITVAPLAEDARQVPQTTSGCSDATGAVMVFGRVFVFSAAYHLHMDRNPLPRISGVSWRPLVPDDAVAMADLHNACNAVDRTFLTTPGEMAEEFDRFGEDANTDSIGAFGRNGEMLALGWSLVPKTGRTEHRAFVWLLVHPGVRGRVEDELVHWIEAVGTNRLRSFDGELPCSLYRYDIYEWMTDEQDLFERHGYDRVRS